MRILKKASGLIICTIILLSIVACAMGAKNAPMADGTVGVFLSLEGGSGKATVERESVMTTKDGISTVEIKWSSPNYDYMIVGDEKIYPVNQEGNSVFEIPVVIMDEPFKVIADTTAMSKPHEIEYYLTVSFEDKQIKETDAISNSIFQEKQNVDEIEKWILDNIGDPKEVELQYSKGFRLQNFDSGDVVIVVNGCDYYLITNNKKFLEKNNNVLKEINVIPALPENIYVVGSGSMDYFVALDSLDKVKYSSLEEKDWSLNKVKKATSVGNIKYAGKYSAPDFEMLLNNGCDLVVENGMINHSPEVLLQLKNLRFPVFIDYSSYETTVLGRMEWIKAYGAIIGKSDAAYNAFEEQKKVINDNKSIQNIDCSIGFFSINSSGTVSVRKQDDNIYDMIKLAGGKNGFKGLIKDKGTGSTTIQLEAFYPFAKDCDILIYNSTISGEIKSKDELVKKCPLITNCKAYKEDRIYCTSIGFYQAVMELGNITADINRIINGSDDITYLYKIP